MERQEIVQSSNTQFFGGGETEGKEKGVENKDQKEQFQSRVNKFKTKRGKERKKEDNKKLKKSTVIVQEEDPIYRVEYIKNLDILVIGSPGVGKSSIMRCFFNNESQENVSIYPGIGAHVFRGDYNLENNRTVRIQIWDSEVTKCLPEKRIEEEHRQQAEIEKRKFYPDFEPNMNLKFTYDYINFGVFHTAIFIFDLTNGKTFEEMEEWFDYYNKNCKTALLSNYAIVGTKLDLVLRCPDKREVSQALIDAWIEDVKDEIDLNESNQEIKYFEVSTYDNINVKSLIVWSIKEGYKRYQQVEKRRYKQKQEQQKEENRECACSIL